MGQRLVISVYENKEVDRPLAKVYFHWSGYTTSALAEARRLIDQLYSDELKDISDMKLRIIKAAENMGGGIDGSGDERKYIENLYPNETFKTEGYSRNEGLVALSEKGMNSMQSWSEGDLDIYLEEEEICSHVYCGYESIEDYNRDRKEWMDEEDYKELTNNDILMINYDMSCLAFSDIDDCLAELNDIHNFVCRYGNEIIDMIA